MLLRSLLLLGACCHLWIFLCIAALYAAPPASAAAAASFAAFSLDGNSQRHRPPGQTRRRSGHSRNDHNKSSYNQQRHPLIRRRSRAHLSATAEGGGGLAGESATGRLVLKGPIFDLLTPFTSEGEADLVAFGEYLKFLSKAGVPTVVCNGETGEFASLTTDERKLLVEFTRNAFSGTVLNHVSASALPDVTRLISHSSGKCGGGSRTVADAVLVMAPYSSFGVSSERERESGTEAFLRKALEGCQLPVFLYSASGNPISPGLYARICEDFPIVNGILDGRGDDTAIYSELKEVLPARQLLVCPERGAGAGRRGPLSDDSPLSLLKAGADVWVTGSSNPLPELAVRMHACHDRGNAGGALEAQRRLNVWAKKREAMSGVCSSVVPVVKAAVAARVPSLKTFTRPPYEELDPKEAADIKRWVCNNDDVVKEKQLDHIKGVSRKLAEVYQRAWNNVEIAGLEMLFRQLSMSEGRLLDVLERARRERAELNGKSIMNASAGEAQAARLLSKVLDARRQLEEDAEDALGPGDTVSTAVATADDWSASGLRKRLEGAMAVAEASQAHLSGLDGVADVAFEVPETLIHEGGGGDSGSTAPFEVNPVANDDASTAAAAAATIVVGVSGAFNGHAIADTHADMGVVPSNGDPSSIVTLRRIDDDSGINSRGENGGLNGSAISRVGVDALGAAVFGGALKQVQQLSDQKTKPPLQQKAELIAATGTESTRGPTFGGLDHRPETSAARRHERGPLEDIFLHTSGERQRRQQQQQQQRERWEEQAKQQQAKLQQHRRRQQQQQQQEHLHNLLHQHQQQKAKEPSLPAPRTPHEDDSYDPFDTLRLFGPASSSPTPAAVVTPLPGSNGNIMSGGDEPLPHGVNRRVIASQEPKVAANSESAAGERGSQEHGSLNGLEAAARGNKEKAARTRTPLPTPRYGRFIPEGSPPRPPTALSPHIPFQGSPPTQQHRPRTTRAAPSPSFKQSSPTRSPPQHFIPYPGGGGSSSSTSSKSGHRGATLEKRNGGGGGQRAQSVVDGGVGPAPQGIGGRTRSGWMAGLSAAGVRGRDGELVRKLGATVDEFKELEKETFFKSKGIEGDVDSFDWDHLRRNTQEIEQLQKKAVDQYWREKSLNPYGHNAHYPRR